ncbi:Phospholipase A1-Igamma3 chloroplastic [Bienertia sinuspersici]
MTLKTYSDPHFRKNPQIQIESGFYDLYTTKEENCKYCSFSAREQVLAEVKRLVERFKARIFRNELNVVRNEKIASRKSQSRYILSQVLELVTLSSRKGPYYARLIANEKKQDAKYLEDKVRFPWSYAHVGSELALDHTHSPFLKPSADLGSAHNSRLIYTSSMDSMERDSSFLKNEYGVPPRWRQEHNKGMVRNSEGRWVVPERARVEHHPPETAPSLCPCYEDCQ